MSKLMVLGAVCGGIGYFVSPAFGVILFLGALIGIGALAIVK